MAGDELKRQAQRLKNYYEKRHPGRQSKFGQIGFRLKEDERIEIVKQWMPDCQGLTVLDAGCGDGLTLARIVRGCPALLRLEDLVPAMVKAAGARLKGRAAIVEAEAVDMADGRDDSEYDLALALGVFDYYADWQALLTRLLERTRGTLIVDFPKSGTPYMFVRTLWLAANFVNVYAADRLKLEALFKRCGVSGQIEEASYNWIVKILLR